MGIKEICEQAAELNFTSNTNGKKRKIKFDLGSVTAALIKDKEFRDLAPTAIRLKGLTPRAFTCTLRQLIRFSLFGQFVNDEITATWYRVRWTDSLEISDPRLASFTVCMDLLEHAAALVEERISTEGGMAVVERLALIRDQYAGLPFDYIDRRNTALHCPSNVELIDPQLAEELALQRALLLNGNNPSAATFKAAYYKLRVKTYLTDRVLTGTHKTNRENRWEAHPDSVHFALKKDCMQIENVLVRQLFHIAGMPESVRDYLVAEEMIRGDESSQLCPVTRDPLQWDEFEAEMLLADHGRSLFQVGHLNPLKSNPDRKPDWGHSAANVSWISQDGNRIQGHLNLTQVRTLLERIGKNYAGLGPSAAE